MLFEFRKVATQDTLSNKRFCPHPLFVQPLKLELTVLRINYQLHDIENKSWPDKCI